MSAAPAVSRYTFSEYSPTWPHEFELESTRLKSLLGEELIEVHHIGSTSVPGLAAKPIIDLLPVVRHIERIDGYISKFEQQDYRSWGEYGLPGRRYFTKDHAGFRTHNIHIYQQGFPEIMRHLAFSAYLRNHEQVREEYAVLKRAVYARHPADVEAYNDAKDAWIKRVERLALEWYKT